MRYILTKYKKQLLDKLSNGPYTSVELAIYMESSKTAIYKSLSDMEFHELVDRAPGGAHGILWRITSEGRNLLEGQIK